MIELSGIRHTILDISALRIPFGTTSVIGPNGSGKTMLLKLLAGIFLPHSGTVRIDGVPPRKTETGWVNEFPDRNILFGTVIDEVASSLRFRHLPDRDVKITVEKLLDSMGISPLRGRPVCDLSGGEKVLVALAAALVHTPRVLVLDECDSHLDNYRARQVERIVQERAIPYVIRCTQQVESAIRSDHVIYLENGRVAYEGVPGEVFARLHGTPFYPLTMECGI
ncbi:ATP-binding cassette domain-containing protein [Methanoregula formicica]|uniref:ABC-type cobalt transport system, ATPase component n=1 Tax=Methanoregula formicica (strain DSM 22288 / NBRC 105244 / SMSP) TaxID=593750 RepID=L0HEZ6_METFS|nr:ATP-binding cassette domain-containing protein [Methanoregula formicica]AGB02361.1 ABC-type cobalt transport system, ATPase component [Methanoregula formicica SMSP]